MKAIASRPQILGAQTQDFLHNNKTKYCQKNTAFILVILKMLKKNACFHVFNKLLHVNENSIVSNEHHLSSNVILTISIWNCIIKRKYFNDGATTFLIRNPTFFV